MCSRLCLEFRSCDLGQHMQTEPGHTCLPCMTPHEEMMLNEGVPAQVPPEETPTAQKSHPEAHVGDGPQAPRFAAVLTPSCVWGWSSTLRLQSRGRHRPGPAKGSRALKSVSEAPLSAINSLEFTLALYIITRLFTAIQGLMQTICRAACLPSPASSGLLIGSCRMGNRGLRGEKTTNRSLVYKAELKTFFMHSGLP